jgi:hypothetical protein
VLAILANGYTPADPTHWPAGNARLEQQRVTDPALSQ